VLEFPGFLIISWGLLRSAGHAGQASVKGGVTSGCYYSDGTLFDKYLPGITGIKQLYTAAVGEYLKDQGVERMVNSVHKQGWAALTRTTDYQTPHLHRGPTICIVMNAFVQQ